jgi:hypothetical protein
MPLGKFDQRVFCGPSSGNRSFARAASSSVVISVCAAATMRAVVPDEPVAAAGVAR